MNDLEIQCCDECRSYATDEDAEDEVYRILLALSGGKLTPHGGFRGVPELYETVECIGGILIDHDEHSIYNCVACGIYATPDDAAAAVGALLGGIAAAEGFRSK